MFGKTLIFVLTLRGFVFALQQPVTNEDLIRELKTLHESKKAIIADGILDIKAKLDIYESTYINMLTSEGRKINQKSSDLTELRDLYNARQEEYYRDFPDKIEHLEQYLKENENNPQLFSIQQQCRSDMKNYMAAVYAQLEEMVKEANEIDKS